MAKSTISTKKLYLLFWDKGRRLGEFIAWAPGFFFSLKGKKEREGESSVSAVLKADCNDSHCLCSGT